jgi:hypothetical protein
MGDIADQLIHDQIFGGYDNGYKSHQPKARSFVWWKQRDGTRIKVHKMDIQHLQNAIKMIETRDYNWRATWYNPLNKELRRKLRKQEKDTK